MPKVVRKRDMAVTPDALRKAITAFAEYPKFLPEVVAAEVVGGSETTLPKVRFEIEVIKRFHYTLEFNTTDKMNISWRLDESSLFKKNEGCWHLTPTETGTHVDYELEVELGFFVPSWVSKRLTEVNLPKLLESFEDRAKKL